MVGLEGINVKINKRAFLSTEKLCSSKFHGR